MPMTRAPRCRFEHPRRAFLLLGLAASLWLAGSPCLAQPPGGRDAQRRGFDPAPFLQRLDANGNGTLEGEELEGRGLFAARMAEEAGLDTARPIPLDRLQEVMRERTARGGGMFGGGRWGGRGRGEGDGERGGGDDPRRGNRDGDSNDGRRDRRGRDGGRQPEGQAEQPKKESLVPGFGINADRPQARGFGPAQAPASGSPPSSPSGAALQSSDGAGEDSVVAVAESAPIASTAGRDRVAGYAESMLKQNDENGNGLLEREEWEKMHIRHHAADANRDGTITKDELTAHLLAYGEQQSAGNSSSISPRYGSPIHAGSRKSYRFRTPAERLPGGLPAWFRDRDADGDGQVVMSEYASSWSDARAAEFARYDLNGDGIITPAEAIKANGK